jgi:hypothetical protein
VLYHGPAPWKSPTDVAAMVDVDDETRALLGPPIPSMHFLLDDLTALNPDQLDARTSSAAPSAVTSALGSVEGNLHASKRARGDAAGFQRRAVR